MSTTILAIRHAKPVSNGYADETLRPLHEEGIKTQVRMAKLLAEKGYAPDLILTSPILRARQTADILAEEFSVNVEESASLGYHFNPEGLITSFPPPEENRTIILIGHAPSLAEFVNELIGKNALPEGLSKSGTAILEFKKEVAIGKAVLLEYLKP